MARYIYNCGNKVQLFSVLFPMMVLTYMSNYFSAIGEGDDFSASSPLQAVFASISDKSCVTITINDDNVFESNHTFTNTLTSLEIDGGTSDPNLSLGSKVYATVIITDNDGKFNLIHPIVPLL